MFWASSPPEPTSAPTPAPEFLVDRRALMELYNAIGGDWILQNYYISLFKYERGFLL